MQAAETPAAVAQDLDREVTLQLGSADGDLLVPQGTVPQEHVVDEQILSELVLKASWGRAVVVATA